jgi:threonine dehydrogenase-like Zn-dependent dehydrogenase
MPTPSVIDPGDVIVKVTGSTFCGSDLHLYHGKQGSIASICCRNLLQNVGVIPQLEKGDVLGHECCGVVERVGPEADRVEVGQRVVV